MSARGYDELRVAVGSRPVGYRVDVRRTVTSSVQTRGHITINERRAPGVRDCRHLVVDHERGHWLGLPHAPCPGPGPLAPVMMQQSQGLDGCRSNPWPLPNEIAARTPSPRLVVDYGPVRPQ